MEAYFDRFVLEMPPEAVAACSHRGDCSADVAAWSPKIVRPAACTADALRRELAEYGAWDEAQLADDTANWERILWIAAGNIQEETRMADTPPIDLGAAVLPPPRGWDRV